MYRKNLMRAVMAGAMVLGPVAALAGIDGSHHDMKNMGAAEEKCAYCHSVVLASGTSLGLGKVGDFCVLVCHQSTSGVAGGTKATPTSQGTYGAYTAGVAGVGTATYGQDGTLAFPAAATLTTVDVLLNGHGMSRSSGRTGGLPTSEMGTGAANGPIPTTGWPYTNSDQLQCTSCHAVHDSANPPFLNAKLDVFCQTCHVDASRNWTAGTDGNHPVNKAWSVSAANAADRDLGPFAGSAFDVATMKGNLSVIATTGSTTQSALDNVTAANMLNKDNHWNLGGHLLDVGGTGLPVSAAGTNPTLTCVSCHMVHDPSGGYQNAVSSLTVGSDPETICYGCHSIEPGSTGMGHPIGQETPITNGHAGWQADLATKMAAGYNTWVTAMGALSYGSNFTVASTGSPKCLTCHDVHGGATGRKAIRSIGISSYDVDTSVCDACHAGSFSNPDGGSDRHHPGVNGTNYTGNNYPSSVSWASADKNGDLTDGLSCQDCHVGDGDGKATPTAKRSTAHNW